MHNLMKQIRELSTKVLNSIRRLSIHRSRSAAVHNDHTGRTVNRTSYRSGNRKPIPSKRGDISSFFRSWSKRAILLTAACTAGLVIASVILGVALSSGSKQGEAAAYQTPIPVMSAEPTEALVSPVAYLASPTAIPTPVPTTVAEIAALLPGCHDPRIISVQERLMDLGYLGSDEPTDYYGTGTQYALQLFQRKHSLQVDGILGEETVNALFAEDAMPYTVKKGDRGTDVSTIQERLKELKYFSGEITGEFGDKTETAVKSFQKRNGLYADGNVGPATREALFSDSARSATGGSSSSGSNSSGSNSSGSHGGGSTIATWEPDSAKVEAMISVAQSLIGSRYVLGGKGPEVFDCSGLVYYCLNQAGYSIGYMTSSGWAKCGIPKVTSMSDMKRGDIICFKGHVGIYLGGGQMIDASSTQGKVRISTTVLTSSYWKANFICARRIF